MRVIITGGAGFIGSHICDRLVGERHEIHVVDNLSSGKREHVPEGATLHVLDIRDPKLAELLATIRPEALIHLAAQMDVRHSVAFPQNDAEINVLGGLNVLEAGRRAGVRRIVYASTGGAVYGEPQSMPVDESHPLRPVSPYGASKQAFEQYLRVYEELYGVTAVVLRLSNVYGPRQDPHGEAGVVAIFSQRCLAGQSCTIYGDGRKTRDYVYVGDVVDAFARSLDAARGGVYNIGRGVEVTDLEVFETVREATHAKLPPLYTDRRPGEVERICLEAGLARRELGWTPATGFREGVALAVAYYREAWGR